MTTCLLRSAPCVASVLLALSCRCWPPARAAPRARGAQPAAENVEFAIEPPSPDTYKFIGKVTGVAAANDLETAQSAARNDLRNKAAALGASLVTIDENIGEARASSSTRRRSSWWGAPTSRSTDERLDGLPSRSCPRRRPDERRRPGSSRSRRSRSAAGATIRASSAARPRASRGSCATASTSRRRRPAGRGVRAGAPRAPAGVRAARAPARGRRAGRGTLRAAEARAADPAGAAAARARRRAARRSGARWARARPGASPSARARRARTARSSRWRGSPRACSACAAATALADAVRAVWASLASGRALAYLAAHGVRDVGMAVVIQRMVEARAAGVMFTRAPDARARGARATSASSTRASGSARPVVDGVTTPDVLRVDARGRLVESHHRAQGARDGRRRDGRRARSTSPTPDAPALVAASGSPSWPRSRARLEKLEPAPWDVEFACDAGKHVGRAGAPGHGPRLPRGRRRGDRLEQRQRRRGAARRRHAAHVVGRRRVQRGRASAARSPRSGAASRSTRASSATSTGAST